MVEQLEARHLLSGVSLLSVTPTLTIYVQAMRRLIEGRSAVKPKYGHHPEA